jgi:hypothetical protein
MLVELGESQPRALRMQGYQSLGEYNYHRKTVLVEITVLLEHGESQPLTLLPVIQMGFKTPTGFPPRNRMVTILLFVILLLAIF